MEKRPPPPTPLFVLCSSQSNTSNDIVHLFPILPTMTSLDFGVEGHPDQLLIGSISTGGTLECWDLIKRKSIWSKSTNLHKSLWADIVPSSKDKVKCFILSREKGLFCIEDLNTDQEPEKLGISVHPGYCKPQLIDFETESAKQFIILPKSEANGIQSLTLDTFICNSYLNFNFLAPVNFIKVLPSLKLLLIGTEEGKVHLIQPGKESPLSIIDLKESLAPESKNDPNDDENEVIPLCCDGNSVHLLIGTSTKTLFLLKIMQNVELVLAKIIPIPNRGTSCISLREDEKIIGTGGWDSRIRVFSFPKLVPKAVLTYHSKPINDLKFFWSSIKASYFLTASSQDSTISVWDLYNK